MAEHEQAVHLVVPVKHLDRAKSRLRGVSEAHLDLVLALLLDTVTAALAAEQVRRVLVICEDDRVPAALRGTGADAVNRPGLAGLNPALAFGADLLAGPGVVVGALQADLPALTAADLTAAITEAGGRRAFCPDRDGTGTTLLLAAPEAALDPRFGPGSAAAHTGSGAVPVGVQRPRLRCDVDTAADLAAASALGLGPRTARMT